MESDWAVQHLQTIRTLMERSAVYRRALAPVMIFTGLLGLAGAVAGWMAGDRGGLFFVLYWATVALLGLAGSLLLVRRQAFKAAEPFWSPPTRRVAAAMMPPLFFGAFLGMVLSKESAQWFLPPLWMALYGCALHSAGFFMHRGIRLFGWVFILAGSAWLLVVLLHTPGAGTLLQNAVNSGHAAMGLSFGAMQLAYGVYLYFTEQSRNET